MNIYVVKSHQDTRLVYRHIFFNKGLISLLIFTFLSGVSKSVIKAMSVMDFEKVNLELIEALLEWIVDGKHSYPPGNCFLSSFICEMAKGREGSLLTETVGTVETASLPGDLVPNPTFHPQVLCKVAY